MPSGMVITGPSAVTTAMKLGSPTRSRSTTDRKESERRLRLGQLALPQLDLDGGPSAVVKLDDEVDLLAVGIAVVVDPAVQRLGIDPRMLHHLRLEPEPGCLQIIHQPVR